MSDCIFCKIANNEAPCFKIWEDDEFLAFLDINPNVKWQTLLIPKQHHDSDLFLINDEKFYGKLISAANEVVDMLKKSLKVQRVWMILNSYTQQISDKLGLNENQKSEFYSMIQ